MSSDTVIPACTFADFGLPVALLEAVAGSGYETPTPIQKEIIPLVLKGTDVVGQAQTGTGKTAAFALPLLARLHNDSNRNKTPQVLVLAPTRELALQVADSFAAYGKHIKKLRTLAIFGGQDYTVQLRQLHKGADIVVGTPGRVMDHLRRNSLKADAIHSLVLDEADEMLKMGFLDDVKWIVEQLPNRRQTALFSATMPPNIRKIAQEYLNSPAEIIIKAKAVTAQTVNQRFLLTGGLAQKVEALARILETENLDGSLVFVRTKLQTVELVEKLTALGFSAAALNGDIQQSQRLRTVEQFKTGAIDILVATDVAARGLDVERISHVINFDIPFDTESYIHRIGRTGRAGRSGEAILLLTPRERTMLRSIERATRQKISAMEMPSVADINSLRIKNFKDTISSTLEGDTAFYETLVKQYLHEHQASPARVAAALAKLAHGSKPFLKPEDTPRQATRRGPNRSTLSCGKTMRVDRAMPIQLPPEEGMERFRLAVGSEHGIKPSNIVGAIANEADINSKYIGRISIFGGYSTVDLPYGMPDNIFRLLKKVRVGGRMLQITRTAGHDLPGAQIESCHKNGQRSGLRRQKQKNIRRKTEQGR
ncbi:MAG: DEAD/DEAH box helicase [Desulforhopalus sp.]